MITVVEAMSTAMGSAITKALDAVTEQSDKVKPKFKSSSSYEFNRKFPKIEDKDPDLERYNREFDKAVRLNEYGGLPVLPAEKLEAYGEGFTKGGTRDVLYRMKIREAEVLQRIPIDAELVLEEIKLALTGFLYETQEQKINRLEDRFQQFRQ